MKQRLIDANRLLTPGYTDMFDEPIHFVSFSREAIENAPTVDAIPVAFIEEKMRKYEELAYNSIPKIQQRYFDKETALKSLINNWREKNGKDDENEL